MIFRPYVVYVHNFKQQFLRSSFKPVLKNRNRLFSSTGIKCGPKSKIGFIGLGNMGSRMAQNLIEKGHNLLVFDVNEDSMKPLGKIGASLASSPADVAEESDSIITMLPNSEHVQTCYTGKNGIFEKIKTGTLLIDSSTISPDVPKTLAKLAVDKGAVFMDAPVSGGINAAQAGTLTFMVGGNKNEFEAVKILLSCMGKNIVYCGDVGSGQAVKICNNMLLAISMIGTAETMNLGMRLGLDPKLLASVVNSSTGRCWSSDTYNPVPGVMEKVPASNNYEGGFGVALMAKDLGLVQEAATKSKTPTPLGSLSHQIYRILNDQGYAEKDFSSIFKFLQNES